MRIVIDYTAAITSRHGIGRYTRSLVDALVRLGADDQFTLFSAERPQGAMGFPTGPNIRSRVLPVGARAMTIVWDRAHIPLPIELFAGGGDVLHGPGFAPPPTLRMPRIATVYDLAFLTVPEFVAPKLIAYQRALIPHTVRNATHVITDSHCTANDVVSLLGAPREKVSVVYLGVDPAFSPVRDPQRLAEIDARYGLVHPVVLALGIIERRKRYDKLIEAFARARTVPGGPKTLAIAGSPGWGADEVLAAVRTCGVEDVVKFLEYVPEFDLATLYSAADVLAMPARYEGFGLPPVEAMACGTPVVTSNTGSLPEVTGDAAIHVDVESPHELADALARVLTDETLRGALIANGFERVRAFTWERAAQQVLDIYRAVASAAPAKIKR